MENVILNWMTGQSTKTLILLTWSLLIVISNVYLLTSGWKTFLPFVEDSFTKELMPVQVLVVILFGWVPLLVNLVWFTVTTLVLSLVTLVVFGFRILHRDK